MRPLIGLTMYTEYASYWIIDDEETVLLPRDYLDMISSVGGTPVLLPPTADAPDAAAHCDGVLVAGGPDIDAARYGATPHPTADVPRTERDAADLAVIRRVLDLGIPMLGVCRGHQLLNVALGGTLHQHLPEDVAPEVAALHSAGNGIYTPVAVTPEPGSRFESVFGTEPVTVRCHHHQAIDRVADGLRVGARAAGDMVEALEVPGETWVVSVQSHPERNPGDLRLARALVDAARERGRSSSASERSIMA